MPSSASRAQTSLRLLTWRARAPRAAFLLAAAVLVAAGLRATFDHPPSDGTTRAAAAPAPERPELGAFAEALTRAYLTRDPARPGAQRAELARLAPPALLEDDEPSAASISRGTVAWTAIAANERDGRQRRITVAADTSQGIVYLELQIAEAADGRLRLADYPAIVGGPPVDRSRDFPAGDPVEDASLLTTARRAVTNYLARRRDALAADLAPGSVVSLPSQPLTLRSIDGVSWGRRGRQIAVLLHAALPDGPVLTLRYRLDVFHRAGRWFVQAVAGQQPTQGVSR